MINIDDRVQELINSTNEMAQETFENPSKMRDFLKTLATMYNTSYNNILLLKSQRDNVSFIATKEEYQKYKYKIKDDEKPLEIIKRIKINNCQPARHRPERQPAALLRRGRAAAHRGPREDPRACRRTAAGRHGRHLSGHHRRGRAGRAALPHGGRAGHRSLSDHPLPGVKSGPFHDRFAVCSKFYHG